MWPREIHFPGPWLPYLYVEWETGRDKTIPESPLWWSDANTAFGSILRTPDLAQVPVWCLSPVTLQVFIHTSPWLPWGTLICVFVDLQKISKSPGRCSVRSRTCRTNWAGVAGLVVLLMGRWGWHRRTPLCVCPHMCDFRMEKLWSRVMVGAH